MLQYIRLFGIALLFSAGIGSVGNAASFDCNKATTETEIAICSDPELSALDELMSKLFPIGSRPINTKFIRKNEHEPLDQFKEFALI